MGDGRPTDRTDSLVECRMSRGTFSVFATIIYQPVFGSLCWSTSFSCFLSSRIAVRAQQTTPSATHINHFLAFGHDMSSFDSREILPDPRCSGRSWRSHHRASVHMADLELHSFDLGRRKKPLDASDACSIFFPRQGRCESDAETPPRGRVFHSGR